MSFLASLPEDARLRHVLKRFARTARPLIEYHEELLRGESPLTTAQRELIAAFVSGLNACVQGRLARLCGGSGVGVDLVRCSVPRRGSFPRAGGVIR